jgi:hypothetical protein
MNFQNIKILPELFHDASGDACKCPAIAQMSSYPGFPLSEPELSESWRKRGLYLEQIRSWRQNCG